MPRSPELTREQLEALEADAEAKRTDRERDVIADTMGNLGRRRAGLEAEKKLLEQATKDAAIAAHSLGFTYEEIADGLAISRQRVAQLLAGRPTSKSKRAKQAAAALERAVTAGTPDGLVPAVGDLAR